MVEQRICYVGGLAEEMTEEALRAAFAPFGEIRECKIPTANKDSKSSKHRGFGFVEFEEEEDAKAAIDNMHESECFGRTLTVNHSRAQANRQPDKAARPIWADQFLHVQKLQAAGLQKRNWRM
ncbi:unnamed protein product [Amoebophrya sp. A25]|nr:unnamed protein product [Amoebophrya sp. A25]|eukprot:GSA25T00025175001.1